MEVESSMKARPSPQLMKNSRLGYFRGNVMQNSTRRGSISLPIQVQSQLYHFKSRILALVAAQVFSVVMVSRLFGISRKTFYKYRHQAEQGSLASFDCTP